MRVRSYCHLFIYLFVALTVEIVAQKAIPLKCFSAIFVYFNFLHLKANSYLSQCELELGSSVAKPY